MSTTILLLVDPNAFRGSAFAALLGPWAIRTGVELHVVQDACEEAITYDLDVGACVINIGGMSLADQDVIRTIDRLRDLFACAPLIVLSDNTDPLEVDIAFEKRVQGFIPTTMPAHVALAAVQFILNGGTYHPHIAPVSRPTSVRDLGGERYPAPAGWLSPVIQDGQKGNMNLIPLKKERHVEVLRYLAQGETNKEIARRLKLTEATVKVYVRELMHHFGAKNRMQVALSSLAAEPANSSCQQEEFHDAKVYRTKQ